MNKHKIAWIALAAGIVMVLMVTWLAGVSLQITHIKESNAQAAQIDENNKQTRDQIETLRIASETIGLQKDCLRQLQRQIPDGYNQQEFIDALNGAAAGAGTSIKSVTFDDATDADTPAEMQGVIKAGKLVQVPCPSPHPATTTPCATSCPACRTSTASQCRKRCPTPLTRATIPPRTR